MLKPTASLSLTLLCAALLLATGGAARAASDWISSPVTSVMVNADDTWGGCMAYLPNGPETKLPSCGEGWVTLSCNGEFTDVVRAYRILDVLQQALATGRSVWVRVRDDKKRNGYCFADIVQIWR